MTHVATPMRAALERALRVDNPRAVDRVLPLFELRACARNETLLRQGQTWAHAFLVERGLLRMHFIRRDGKEFNKSFHAEGALVCPITREMDEAASLFAISAVERSTLWQAPTPAFRASLAAFDAWEPLRAVLLERLITHKLQREYDLLALDGRTRYQQFCARAPELAARVPLSHLATYLGLTDVSLSRIRRQLKNSPE